MRGQSSEDSGLRGQSSEDSSLRGQKTENPSARFFVPHPARSAQADLSSVFSNRCPLKLFSQITVL
ncbi:MAG: hypothetical protein LBD06_06130 [Candidatus Accumulibacter sp.]|nr:hypothetical protein [Accumulibacter sp.]